MEIHLPRIESKPHVEARKPSIAIYSQTVNAGIRYLGKDFWTPAEGYGYTLEGKVQVPIGDPKLRELCLV